LSFSSDFYSISALMMRRMLEPTRLLTLLNKTQDGESAAPPTRQMTRNDKNKDRPDPFGFPDLGGPWPTTGLSVWRQMVGLFGLLCVVAAMASPQFVLAKQSRYVGNSATEPAVANSSLGLQTEWVALTALPLQAQDVYQRILTGGPFRYEKDGVAFGNRERLLPRQRRGFYREYTVPTPGEHDRGARRIVCGGKEVRQPETCFYSGDHYASFRAIDPQR
jgi:ribonuclease T1